MGLFGEILGELGGEILEKTGIKDVINSGKDVYYATKLATKSPLLPDDVYSYSDLENSKIGYAKYLNATSELQNYVEPNFYKFQELIFRNISKSEDKNSAHKEELLNVYKLFLYNFGGKSLKSTINENIEEYLAYSLSVVSAKHELNKKGIDLFENNAAEKKSRELFRKYFPDLFDKIPDEKYKTAIHCILHGKKENLDPYIVRCINLIDKLLFLSENPDVYVKRGYKSYQEDLKEIEEKRKKEEEAKRRAEEKKEAKKIEREKQAEAKKQQLLTEERKLLAQKQKRKAEAEAEKQKKKERLLHADDDL